jgi:photosystem II stability/assembly factor-like uncharacterized protein
MVAAGLDGIIIYSQDRGKIWLPSKVPSKKSIYGITVHRNMGWAVGDEGTVLLSTDGGKSWRTVDVPLAYKLFWIGTVSFSYQCDLDGYGAGAHGIFFRIKKETLVW